MKKKVLSVAGLSLFLSLSLTSCHDANKEKSINTEPITFEKEGELYLIRPSGDTLKKLDIEFAESDYEHQTGLMYRDGMEKDQGMLFVYENESQHSFYMKNTYFSLDIIYYDRDSSLVSIQQNALPRDETSLPSEGPAQYILEVNAGLSDELGLEKGDKISFYKKGEN